MVFKTSIPTGNVLKDNNSDSPRHYEYPRWFGGSASCGAVLVSHPFDLIKAQMQNASTGSKQSFLRLGNHIYSVQGIKGLYKGLSAGFMRSLTYGTTRVALYEEIKKNMDESSPTRGPELVLVAGISGFVGAMFGTPSDIANIRMQTDISYPPNERRNYKHVFDAWVQMKRHEGWGSFKQGLGLNCTRCAVMTVGQLASYDMFKKLLERHFLSNTYAPGIEFGASVLASLTATTLCSPMDVIRTNIMASKQSKPSTLVVVGSLTRENGFKWIFRGWVPSFVRLGPQTVATLLLLEQQRRIYRHWKRQ